MKLFKIKKKWNRRDLILLFGRLELYVGAGLTLDKAMSAAGEGLRESHKESIASVRQYIESGSALFKAMKSNIAIPETISGMIEQGQSSGELAKSFGAARILLEREDELAKKCVSAMTYPCVIGVFAFLLTIGLMRGVMPQIIPMLKGLRVQLPLLTRAVIFISDNMLSHGLYGVAVLLIFVAIFKYSYRKSSRFRELAQSFFLHVPIIGRLVLLHSLSLFTRSCGSLIGSGLSAASAYQSAANAVFALPLQRKLISREKIVSNGLSIGTAIADIKRLPRYVAPLISAGEASGCLGSSLIKSADIIDKDMEHALKKLTALIEPLMMAVMGLAVGAIALSIMMPIYDMSKALQK